MKIGTIVTATDVNPLYCDFIPNFVAAWKALVPEADICIVMIADAIPEAFRAYSPYIKVFPPIPGMHTAFQAQCIRLLYPREVTRDSGVLITDMDILPMNRSYYVDSIREAPADAFVVYRDVCLPSEISMCYNVAHPAIWSSVFGTTPTADLLQEWYRPSGYDGNHGGAGWNTDQLILVKAFNEWRGRKIVLNDRITRFSRLDRGMPMEIWEREHARIRNRIIAGKFADYHCLRPYKQFRHWNDWIVSCLQEVQIS